MKPIIRPTLGEIRWVEGKLICTLLDYFNSSDLVLSKETVRGGRVAEMSAHSIQHCDWPTWRRAARSANHSAESSGPTFRLLFLLSWSLCHMTSRDLRFGHTKDTVRGGRVAEMSAHSIQRCDWPTWRHAARSANHSAESSGPTFRLRFLLSGSP